MVGTSPACPPCPHGAAGAQAVHQEIQVCLRHKVSGLPGPRDFRKGCHDGPAQGSSGGRLARAAHGSCCTCVPRAHRVLPVFHTGLRLHRGAAHSVAAKRRLQVDDGGGMRVLCIAPCIDMCAGAAAVGIQPRVHCGAVLHQGAGPVAFFSRKIMSCHAKLATYERELIRLVQAVRHLRLYGGVNSRCVLISLA
jgi:hypothetical protein